MSKEMAFTVFCLESYKAHRHLSGHEAFSLFERYGVFDYIREFYDVLHTTGHHISIVILTLTCIQEDMPLIEPNKFQTMHG